LAGKISRDSLGYMRKSSASSRASNASFSWFKVERSKPPSAPSSKQSGVNLDAVEFFVVPTDRGWMRDSGPICVTNSSHEVAYTHWQFNGWAKYSNHKKDALAVTRANKKLKCRTWQPRHKGHRVTSRVAASM
jgi:hypothetical protein